MSETEVPKLDLSTLDPAKIEIIRRFIVVLEGGDPDTQPTMNKFMNIESNVERTNLPTRSDVHFVSFLDFVSKAYFENMANPFDLLKDTVAITFMAKGGMKSNQTVDLLRNNPDLSAFQTALQIQDSQKQRGFMDKLLGRRKEE